MNGEVDLLASCYRRSLEVAAAAHIKSVAFPCISTGIYGYPMDKASRVAVAAVRSALRDLVGIQLVVFCCFSDADLAFYEELLYKNQ